MFFTPIESLPYRELVSDYTPSISRVFSAWGFDSSVIQVVKMSGFGFERIYDYIGIDKNISLVGDHIDKDPSGRYASSEEVANKIIELTAEEDKSFVYAFANSSHMPWKLKDYPNNSIELLHDHGLSGKKLNQMLAYFNAIRHVESLLTKLVTHYEKSGEKTVILFMGDHHPALDLLLDDVEKSEIYQSYVVPALIWSNYHQPKAIDNDFFTSVNFMSSKVLNVLGLEANGFFKFNAEAKDALSVLSPRYPLNKLTKNQQQWLQEYEILQYKILMEPEGNHLY